MRKVLAEIADLATNSLEGIKVVVNDEDLSEVHAWISGPAGTPYEGGNFRIKLVLGPDFPQSPPKGYFITKIFHPNVSNTGDICVNTLKKDWKEDLGIKHVLLTVKCLLIVPNPESALNEEAGRLLLERYEDYARKAQLMTSIHAAAAEGEASSSSAAAAASSADAAGSSVAAKKPAKKAATDKKLKRSLKRL
jgi:ubiquitin-conjugating enzyme E2 S